jgi:hypothetical protein
VKRYSKKQPYHTALIEFLEEKNWAALPTGQHTPLVPFLKKWGLSRQQVANQFSQWRAARSGLHSEFDSELEVQLNIRSMDELVEALYSTEAFLQLSGKTRILPEGERTTLKTYIQEQQSFFTDLREEIMAALTKAMTGITKSSQWRARSRLYSSDKDRLITTLTQGFCTQDENWSLSVAKLQVFAEPFVELLESDAQHPGGQVSMKDLIQKALDRLEQEGDVFPADDARCEVLYYIAGWQICAVKKYAGRMNSNAELKTTMTKLIVIANETDENELHQLPIAKVRRVEAFGGMMYPTFEFYTFIACIEKICNQVLTNAGMITFGGEIVKKLKESLVLDNSLKTKLQELLDLDPNDDDVDGVYTYIVQTYMRMRGKDFVRRVMATLRRNNGTQLRHELATLSKERAKGGKKRKKSTRRGSLSSFKRNNVSEKEVGTELELETEEEELEQRQERETYRTMEAIARAVAEIDNEEEEDDDDEDENHDDDLDRDDLDGNDDDST